MSVFIEGVVVGVLLATFVVMLYRRAINPPPWNDYLYDRSVHES